MDDHREAPVLSLEVYSASLGIGEAKVHTAQGLPQDLHIVVSCRVAIHVDAVLGAVQYNTPDDVRFTPRTIGVAQSTQVAMHEQSMVREHVH